MNQRFNAALKIVLGAFVSCFFISTFALAECAAVDEYGNSDPSCTEFAAPLDCTKQCSPKTGKECGSETNRQHKYCCCGTAAEPSPACGTSATQYSCDKGSVANPRKMDVETFEPAL